MNAVRLRQRLFTYVLWLVLAVPLAVAMFRYWNGDIYYGGFVHDTGRYSAWLVFLTLAISPLRMLFPGAAWSRWLMQNRRYFGVAVFAYALAHTMAYLIRTESLERWLEDAAMFEMWTGWLALGIFFVLAATSNDWSLRLLRSAWKQLHRWVHVGAVLVLVHWIFTAFDPFVGYVHLAILAVIEAARLLMPIYSRRKRAA